jgi:hypothetical protein
MAEIQRRPENRLLCSTFVRLTVESGRLVSSGRFRDGVVQRAKGVKRVGHDIFL